MRVSIALALLLAAALFCAEAAHSPSQTTRIAEEQGGGGGKEESAPVAFRYLVEPSKRKDFEKVWSKHEKATTQEKDVVMFDLKFPVGSNAEYVGYGEWKDMRAYADHYESDHTKEFLDQLAKMDVPYTLEVLKHPAAVGELHRAPHRGEEHNLAHVLIRYSVKPSAHKQFLDAWNTAEQATESEHGAHIYSLRRLVATNTEYYAYGTWASMKDYAAHFESDHVKQLLQTLEKHNVVWHLTPLKKVGDQPE